MFIIPLFVILPLLGAFIISFIGKYSKTLNEVLTNFITFILFIMSILSIFIFNIKDSVYIYKLGGWPPPIGISLVLDGLSVFILISINFIAFMITLFSIDYMERFTEKFRFYTLFLLMLAGMNGVIIAGDIFNLFVFLEIASVASYALVAYGVEKEELEASFKYMIMGSLASLFILLSIAFLYSYTSTLNMADISDILIQKGINKIVIFSAILFIIGFGIKSAIVPFHAWLPDAHASAPAPISATLSGVLIKVLGIYSFVRIFYNVIGLNSFISNFFVFLGTLSIIVGVFLAIGQMDLKRLLAYHSVSQVGYIILGFGIGTTLGISGALFHLLNHSIFKSLLFLNSGAVEYTIETRNLEEMGGLREKMPFTAGTSLIASMSISGIPPFNGFFSKVMIILACIQNANFYPAIFAMIGSILTLCSFMKLQKYAFFGILQDKYRKIKEVPFFMRTSMISLAIVCLFGGILLLPKLDGYFLKPAERVLSKKIEYKNIILEANEK